MKFYRYEFREYGTYDFDGEYMTPIFPKLKLILQTYTLLKETPKGYWIGSEGFSVEHWKKWIPKNSKRRFAYPTQKEALDNFIKRNKRRVEILEWKLNCCKIMLDRAKYEIEKL